MNTPWNIIWIQSFSFHKILPYYIIREGVKKKLVKSGQAWPILSFIKWQNNPKYDNLSRIFHIFLIAFFQFFLWLPSSSFRQRMRNENKHCKSEKLTREGKTFSNYRVRPRLQNQGHHEVLAELKSVAKTDRLVIMLWRLTFGNR